MDHLPLHRFQAWNCSEKSGTLSVTFSSYTPCLTQLCHTTTSSGRHRQVPFTEVGRSALAQSWHWAVRQKRKTPFQASFSHCFLWTNIKRNTWCISKMPWRGCVLENPRAHALCSLQSYGCCWSPCETTPSLLSSSSWESLNIYSILIGLWLSSCSHRTSFY